MTFSAVLDGINDNQIISLFPTKICIASCWKQRLRRSLWEPTAPLTKGLDTALTVYLTVWQLYFKNKLPLIPFGVFPLLKHLRSSGIDLRVHNIYINLAFSANVERVFSVQKSSRSPKSGSVPWQSIRDPQFIPCDEDCVPSRRVSACVCVFCLIQFCDESGGDDGKDKQQRSFQRGILSCPPLLCGRFIWDKS